MKKSFVFSTALLMSALPSVQAETRAELVALFKKQFPTVAEKEIKKLNMQDLRTRLSGAQQSTEKSTVSDAQTQTETDICKKTGINWEKFFQQFRSFDSVTFSTSHAPGKTYVVKKESILEYSSLIMNFHASDDDTSTVKVQEIVETTLHPLLLEAMVENNNDADNMHECCKNNEELKLTVPEIATLIDQATFLGCLHPLIKSNWYDISKLLESLDGATAYAQHPHDVQKIIKLTDNLLWKNEDQDHPALQTKHAFLFLRDALERNCIDIEIKDDETLEQFMELCTKSYTFPRSINSLTVENCYIEELNPSLFGYKGLVVDNLTIRNCQNLRNFGYVTVKHSVTIENCPEIATIAPLVDNKQLCSLSITSCPKLIDIGDPKKIINLNIDDCNALERINGIRKTESFSVTNCAALTTLNGLESIECLHLSNLPCLNYLGGLKNVSGNCSLYDCTSLTSLQALETVKELTLYSCNNMTNMSSLGYAQKISIHNCPQLHVPQRLIDSLGNRYTNS